MKMPEIDSPDKQIGCMIGFFYYESDSRVQNYVKFLLAKGMLVDIICLGKADKNSIVHADDGISLFKIHDRGYENRGKANYLRDLFIFFFIAMYRVSCLFFKKKYCFIHVHNLPDILVFTTWLPKLFGCKIILDIHDILPELYARKFDIRQGSAIIRFLEFIEKMSCRFADHTIIANEIWRQKVLKRSLNNQNSKCTAIPNFPDTTLFSPPKNLATSTNNNHFTVIYHGWFTEHHGLDLAIKAVHLLHQKISNLRFFIYGKGPFESEIKALIQSLQADKYVIEKGFIDYQKIPQILVHADLGIVPKKDGLFAGEALSTKLFEYVSMGIPVVVSKTTAEQVYFDDNEVKYFKPNDYIDLANCIEYLYNNPRERSEMAKRASLKAKNYDLNSLADTYISIVNQLKSL